MKLYTEEQIRHIFENLSVSSGYDYNMETYCDSITPIELPSDDEMANASNHCKDGQVKIGFLRGVLWYQEKILNQTK